MVGQLNLKIYLGGSIRLNISCIINKFIYSYHYLVLL